MAKISASVTFKRAWWVMPYITLAVWLWRIVRHGPKPETVERIVRRGFRVDVD
jgi:hypothetical protein